MQRFLVLYEKNENGYSAYVPDLPGCIATGKTKEEVEELIYGGIKFHVEGMKLEGIEIPECTTESEVLVLQ
ncbi:MAG: type II toxin-antitoxin system HicB family antitoxin [Ignavibacteriales bacterium]|nr:type II toxin-antitoxin system HicB family antitoxin [Ignavibacteriales bacterium]